MTVLSPPALRSALLSVVVDGVLPAPCEFKGNCVLLMIMSKQLPTVAKTERPICNCFADHAIY